MLVRHRSKRFEGTLHNPLSTDIGPASSRHLSIHHQPFALQLMKVLPVGPCANQIRIRNQDAWREFMRAEDGDRLTRLAQQSLIVLKLSKLGNDRFKTRPVARCSSFAAINNKLPWFFGDIR